MNALQCPALDRHPHGDTVRAILQAALQAADPAAAVRRALEEDALPQPPSGRIFLLAVGKAAPAMTAAFVGLQADRLAGGLLIPKHPACPPHPALRMQTGEHPVPGVGSLRAGQAALRLAESLTPADLLVVLLSGGGSALMTAPLPGLTLPRLQALTDRLLAVGAPIQAINTLRRHLDQVKGGRLAARTQAAVVSLILSDVVGSPLEAIASGPTAPDPTTRADALAVLSRYGLEKEFADVARLLQNAPETPKAGHPCFRRVRNRIIADNALAVSAAVQAARRAGLHTRNLGSHWQGEARTLAAELVAQLRQADLPRPFVLVAGGESTVTLRGNGLGGRNQELALAAVPLLAGLPDVLLVTLATDGEDGPTEATGAAVTGETLAAARALGLDPDDFLCRNDSGTFFQRLGNLLVTGPTGTNVNDLTLLFAF